MRIYAITIPVCGQAAAQPPSSAQGASVASPIRDVKDAAKEPFQKGLFAAQQQDWKLAIRYFLEAQKADPDAPQIWFNLGLASSKLPGYELRALAWFQAYLLAVPDAPNADAIRNQIATLEVTLESHVGRIADGLEAVASARIAGGLPADGAPRFFVTRAGLMLGAARNFVGDLPGAVRTLEATTGHGLADFDISNCKSVPGLILANSLVAAGQFRATVGKKMMDCVWPPVTEYLLEAGDFDDASRSINGYHWDNVSPEWIWIKEACAAFDGRDVKTLHDVQRAPNPCISRRR